MPVFDIGLSDPFLHATLRDPEVLGDCPALEQFLGSGAGLSAASITRLTGQWQDEAKAFAARDLSGTGIDGMIGNGGWSAGGPLLIAPGRWRRGSASIRSRGRRYGRR